ncbi:MAG: copper amine oxidase N-terminal domain-containing protein [Abditibacteriales bacterium]|nr:copper amine oxidase N-terminal domain-containing protein [Abditibacteriales bacterium]MDW8365823.1 stalk domain-containing protein [Abditibacteriales bacterium]
MKHQPQRVLYVLLLLLSSPPGTAGQAIPPPRLEINGEPAPVNLRVLERGKDFFVPAVTLIMLGWQVRWENGRESVVVSNGDAIVQLTAHSGQALVRSQQTEPPTPKPFRPVPLLFNGQLWLPASALRDLLQVKVEWDAAARVLRLGEAPKPEAGKLREWCEALDVRDPSLFHQSGFRVMLQVPQGRELEGQEFALIARANGDACLQIYEIYEGGRPKALFGKDRSGLIVYYPEAEGLPVHWVKIIGGRTYRYHQKNAAKGKVTYIAIALPLSSKPPDPDLLGLLQRSVAAGRWSISAVEFTVQPEGGG